MIEFVYKGTRVKCRPERAQEMRDRMDKADKTISPKAYRARHQKSADSRIYPVFRLGMSTQEYINKYQLENCKISIFHGGFEPLPDKPCALYYPLFPLCEETVEG